MQKVQQCMVARFAAVRLFIPVLVLIIWTLQPYLLCDWMPRRYSASLRMCPGHKPFVLHQDLVRLDSVS